MRSPSNTLLCRIPTPALNAGHQLPNIGIDDILEQFLAAAAWGRFAVLADPRFERVERLVAGEDGLAELIVPTAVALVDLVVEQRSLCSSSTAGQL